MGANATQNAISTGGEIGFGAFGQTQVGEHDDRKFTYGGFVGPGQRSSNDGKIYVDGPAVKGYADVELVRKFVDLELSGSFGLATDGSHGYYKEASVGLPIVVTKNIKIVPEVRYATLANHDISESSTSALISLRASFGN